MAKIGNPSGYFSSSTDDDDLPVKQPQRRPVKQPQRLNAKQPEPLALKQPERISMKQAERRMVKQPERVSVKKENAWDSDALEDWESAEKGVEVVQVGEEWCAVPFDLFDLPDLKGILSLDAWNVSLTEEEREKLAVFLPALEDEGMFKSTVVDLLGGEQFHFGNPLSDFFDRLKRGFYQPRIANYREGLKYLQRKEHYHSLRKYHNGMVNGFHEMQKLWEDYPDAEIDARIEIWNVWKTQKAKPPAEVKPMEIKVTFLQKDKALPHPDRKIKILKSKALSKEMVFAEEKQILDAGRAGPKGLLKVKATMKGGPQDDTKELSTKENRANGPGPRGVLKVVRARSNPIVEILANETHFVPEERKRIAGRGTRVAAEEDYLGLNEGIALQMNEKKRKSNPIESTYKKKSKQENRGEGNILGHTPWSKHRDVNDGIGGVVEKKESSERGLEHFKMNVKKSRSKQEPLIKKGTSFDHKQRHPFEENYMPTEGKEISWGIQVGAGEMRAEAKLKKKKDGFIEEKLEAITKRSKEEENFQRTVEQSKVDLRYGKQKKEEKSNFIKGFDKEQSVVGSVWQVKHESKDYHGHAEEHKLETVDRSRGTLKNVERRELGEVKKRPYSRKKHEVGNKADDFGEKAENDEMESKRSKQKYAGFPIVPSEAEPQGRPSALKMTKRQNPADHLARISLKIDSSPSVENFPEKGGSGSAMKSSKNLVSSFVQSLASTFPFSVRHLLSAVRIALLYAYEENGFNLYQHAQAASLLSGVIQKSGTSESNTYGEDASSSLFQRKPNFLASEGSTGRYSMSLSEILKRVQKNPGDKTILESEVPLQDLVRGVLKVFSSKSAAAGVKGWKPLASYDKERKSWSWIGPPPGRRLQDSMQDQISPEAWGLPPKTILKMEEIFADWYKHRQESFQQIVSLPLPPPMPIQMDEKERFRELRAQKSLITITPSSEDARAYFRMEELQRYSIPDRAFAYTAADGQKSLVAPLRRCGAKLNSKARDHFILKPDRPSHVTILCLVRDAAARLPKSIGTRADVSALIRDSQFVMEDVSDAQVNHVVSGALDRLHYERDPCVRFDGDRKLWLYLHADRREEDFEDDGTFSTKRWKRPRKDALDSLETGQAGYDDTSPYAGDQDLSGKGIGLELNSPDGMDTGDASAIYSAGSAELVYNKSSSLASPRVLRNSMSRSFIDDENLPYMELPPVQSSYMNLQNGTLATSWNEINDELEISGNRAISLTHKSNVLKKTMM